MEDILIKIQKLLAKAESSKEIGSIAEAELFATKANELLLQYNLDLSDLDKLKEKHSKISESETIKYYTDTKYGLWEIDLINIIANYNFCKAIFHANDHAVTIYGFSHNIEVVKYLYDSLKIRFIHLADKIYSDKVIEIRNTYKTSTSSNITALNVFRSKYPELGEIHLEDIMAVPYTNMKEWCLKTLSLGGLTDRSTFVRSFLLGVPKGLSNKFFSEREKMKKQSEDINKSITALVLSNNTGIEKYIKEKVGKTKSFKGSTPTNVDGFKEGVKSGENASLNSALNSSGTRSNLLN